MKHLSSKTALGAIALIVSSCAPAFAQNADHIARVQDGQSCVGCNLFQADLSYRDLPRIDVSGARLTQSNLSLATMNGARFNGADLSISNLYGGRFTGASFVDADLSRTTLVGTYWGSADLSRANLDDANLSGAEMGRVRGLTQAQLETACGDAATQLPAGLSVRACR